MADEVMRLHTPHRMEPWEIIWQDAREALQAIGFVPTNVDSGVEYWGRGKRVVKLIPTHPDGMTETQTLVDAQGVYFSIVGDTLVASV